MIKETEKKPGRPIGVNFKHIKYLRLTDEQNKNWDRNTPKAIRDFLDGNLIELLKQLYDFMGDYMVVRDNKKEEVKDHRELIVEIKEMIKKNA